jgi:transporter family protein
MSAFVMALLAALAWGTASFVEKIGLKNPDAYAGVWARNMGVFAGTMLLFFMVPNMGARVGGMGWYSFWLLAGGGCFASVLGQIFFYKALKLGEIGKVATVAGAWPLWAFLLSFFFLGEALTLKKTAGLLLVSLGVFLLR